MANRLPSEEATVIMVVSLFSSLLKPFGDHTWHLSGSDIAKKMKG